MIKFLWLSKELSKLISELQRKKIVFEYIMVKLIFWMYNIEYEFGQFLAIKIRFE